MPNGANPLDYKYGNPRYRQLFSGFNPGSSGLQAQPVVPQPPVAPKPLNFGTDRKGADRALGHFVNPEANLVQGQYNFAAEQQPALFDAIRRMMGLVQDVPGQANAFRRQAQTQADNSLPGLLSQLTAAGAGSGAREGAVLANQYNTNRQANDFMGMLMGPQGQQQIAQLLMQLSQAGNPNLSNLLNMAPQQQQSSGGGGGLFGGILGSVLGGPAGGVLAGLLGGNQRK